jgi:hypothetical protein
MAALADVAMFGVVSIDESSRIRALGTLIMVLYSLRFIAVLLVIFGVDRVK